MYSTKESRRALKKVVNIETAIKKLQKTHGETQPNRTLLRCSTVDSVVMCLRCNNVKNFVYDYLILCEMKKKKQQM